MGRTSLFRVGYVIMVVQGLLSVFAPKKAIRGGTLGWRLGFENVDDLEPREWYVEQTRILGVGMLAAGLTGLLVSDAESAERERAADEAAATEMAVEDGDDEDDDDDDGGPVTIDV
jgi:hypothetical protein